MTDEELIKEFWISLRAEEIANGIADPELDMEGHWAAFENATVSADFEWFANYEGLRANEFDGPLINEARKLLERCRIDEETAIQGKTLVDAAKEQFPGLMDSEAQYMFGGNGGPKKKPLTDGEKIAFIPHAPSFPPIFRGGWVIGATRLRNSSPKPVSKNKPEED